MAPETTLHVAVPLNIGEYHQIGLAVLSELYLGFPLNNTVISDTKIAEILKLDNIDTEMPSGRKFRDVLEGTVEHLQAEGYIRPLGPEEIGNKWKLTDKGFERMNAPLPSLSSMSGIVTVSGTVGNAVSQAFQGTTLQGRGTIFGQLMKFVIGGR